MKIVICKHCKKKLPFKTSYLLFDVPNILELICYKCAKLRQSLRKKT